MLGAGCHVKDVDLAVNVRRPVACRRPFWSAGAHRRATPVARQSDGAAKVASGDIQQLGRLEPMSQAHICRRCAAIAGSRGLQREDVCRPVYDRTCGIAWRANQNLVATAAASCGRHRCNGGGAPKMRRGQRRRCHDPRQQRAAPQVEQIDGANVLRPCVATVGQGRTHEYDVIDGCDRRAQLVVRWGRQRGASHIRSNNGCQIPLPGASTGLAFFSTIACIHHPRHLMAVMGARSASRMGMRT